MKETHPTGYYPKRADWLYLNHSRGSTSCRSEMIDPSLESCDSRLQEELTLPSLTQPTVKGTPPKVGQTLDFSPSRDFSQSARPVTRLGFGGVIIFREEVFFLFPTTPTPFTSSDSSLSYSTRRSASQEETSEATLVGLLHRGCSTPGLFQIRWSRCFYRTMLSPLSPDTKFDYFRNVEATLEVSEAQEPLQNGRSGHLQPGCPTHGPSWIGF